MEYWCTVSNGWCATWEISILHEIYFCACLNLAWRSEGVKRLGSPMWLQFEIVERVCGHCCCCWWWCILGVVCLQCETIEYFLLISGFCYLLLKVFMHFATYTDTHIFCWWIDERVMDLYYRHASNDSLYFLLLLLCSLILQRLILFSVFNFSFFLLILFCCCGAYMSSVSTFSLWSYSSHWHTCR